MVSPSADVLYPYVPVFAESSCLTELLVVNYADIESVVPTSKLALLLTAFSPFLIVKLLTAPWLAESDVLNFAPDATAFDSKPVINSCKLKDCPTLPRSVFS
jgi:hypothetical protein